MNGEETKTVNLSIASRRMIALGQIYDELKKELPEEAKEHYENDLFGYKAQAYKDRMNDVFGIDGWIYQWGEPEYEEVNGEAGYSVTLLVTVSVPGFGLQTTAVGTHASPAKGTALKGAITNGLKKALSNWGVGSKALLGALKDDDADPMRVTPQPKQTGPVQGTIFSVPETVAGEKKEIVPDKDEKKDEKKEPETGKTEPTAEEQVQEQKAEGEKKQRRKNPSQESI